MTSTFPIDDLVRAVTQAAQTRSGRLVRITLAGAPPNGEAVATLSERLAGMGLGTVEVTWVTSTGEPRVLALEFKR